MLGLPPTPLPNRGSPPTTPKPGKLYQCHQRKKEQSICEVGSGPQPLRIKGVDHCRRVIDGCPGPSSGFRGPELSLFVVAVSIPGVRGMRRPLVVVLLLISTMPLSASLPMLGFRLRAPSITLVWLDSRRMTLLALLGF